MKRLRLEFATWFTACLRPPVGFSIVVRFLLTPFIPSDPVYPELHQLGHSPREDMVEDKYIGLTLALAGTFLIGWVYLADIVGIRSLIPRYRSSFIITKKVRWTC